MEKYDGVRYITTAIRESAVNMMSQTNSPHYEQINLYTFLQFREKSLSLCRLKNSRMYYKHVYDWKDKTNDQINREFSELNWSHRTMPKEEMV